MAVIDNAFLIYTRDDFRTEAKRSYVPSDVVALMYGVSQVTLSLTCLLSSHERPRLR